MLMYHRDLLKQQQKKREACQKTTPVVVQIVNKSPLVPIKSEPKEMVFVCSKCEESRRSPECFEFSSKESLRAHLVGECFFSYLQSELRKEIQISNSCPVKSCPDKGKNKFYYSVAALISFIIFLETIRYKCDVYIHYEKHLAERGIHNVKSGRISELFKQEKERVCPVCLEKFKHFGDMFHHFTIHHSSHVDRFLDRLSFMKTIYDPKPSRKKNMPAILAQNPPKIEHKSPLRQIRKNGHKWVSGLDGTSLLKSNQISTITIDTKPSNPSLPPQAFGARILSKPQEVAKVE